MNASSTRAGIRGNRIKLRRRLLLLALIGLPLCYAISNRAHAQGSGFGGNHEVADCESISGWAWNVSQPNDPIVVDIIVDGSFIAQVAADEFRQDLLDAGVGDGRHGFTFPTPNSLKTGQSHSVRVRFTGTNQDLSNTPRTLTCGQFDFRGNFEIADCTEISGWAWDANQPNTPINVDLYFDNNAFVSIIAPADQFRQDLLDAGIGNGFHAFTVPTPASLKDGQPHTVRVKFGGTTTEIGGSPRMLTCAPVGETFGGNHESADCQQTVGWAWDSSQPNTPISVDIYGDNTFLATVVANQFRQDLLDAGIGNGSHGFSFAIPMSLKDGVKHAIKVTLAGTQQLLGNTPRFITCSGGPIYQGRHEVANCTTIAGWAWDVNQPNTPISVDIYNGFVFIGTVPANEFRQDLLDAGIGNGAHGFTFSTPMSLVDGQPHSIRVRFAGTMTDLQNTPIVITCN